MSETSWGRRHVCEPCASNGSTGVCTIRLGGKPAEEVFQGISNETKGVISILTVPLRFLVQESQQTRSADLQVRDEGCVVTDRRNDRLRKSLACDNGWTRLGVSDSRSWLVEADACVEHRERSRSTLLSLFV